MENNISNALNTSENLNNSHDRKKVRNNIKLDSYKKYYNQLDNERLHDIYFKINFKLNNESLKKTEYQYYLDILQTYNFKDFFAEMDIIIETYAYEFLTNSKDEYFINMKLFYPSIKALLEYKNSLCIYPECTELILNIADFFCQTHLNSDVINNYEFINSCFDTRNSDLDQIYENYKDQYDLKSCLEKYASKNNNSIIIKTSELDNVVCFLEITEDIDNMIEISLDAEFSELDCLIMNDIDSEISSDDEDDIKLKKILSNKLLDETYNEEELDNQEEELNNQEEELNNQEELDNEELDIKIKNKLNVKKYDIETIRKCFSEELSSDSDLDINSDTDSNLDFDTDSDLDLSTLQDIIDSLS
jgi:hypothetical protein